MNDGIASIDNLQKSVEEAEYKATAEEEIQGILGGKSLQEKYGVGNEANKEEVRQYMDAAKKKGNKALK